MNINNNLITQNTYYTERNEKVNKLVNEKSYQTNMPISSAEIIQYYKLLCKEFPDITFRLGDRSDIEEAEYYTGYENSSHQQGNNFSAPGQCSIEIDSGVIEKMMKDDKFAFEVKGTIQSLSSKYGVFEGWAKADGYSYTSVNIWEGEQGLTHSITCSSTPIASADEAVKSNQSNPKDLTKQLFAKYHEKENNLEDIFFKMMDESKQKRMEINY